MQTAAHLFTLNRKMNGSDGMIYMKFVFFFHLFHILYLTLNPKVRSILVRYPEIVAHFRRKMNSHLFCGCSGSVMEIERNTQH